jgi:hypothetical protein
MGRYRQEKLILIVAKQTEGAFLTQNRDMLVFLIENDEEWFSEWVADHPPPSGINLPHAIASSNETEEPERE